MEKIVILMATYNGEKYIEEQIQSIISQTFQNWELYVRDDGSSDSTVHIIELLCKQDNRINLLNDKEKHLGAKHSFLRLLSKVDGDLYMFCDQDDVWLPNKIERTLKEYKKQSQLYSGPIVIHTDVKVVDENLNTISHSYFKSIKINPDKYKSYNYLAIICFTQGATMLFNNEAKYLCFPLPKDPRMHDFWVSTRVLRNGGRIFTIYDQTMLYRQHGNNVYGANIGKNNSLLSCFLSTKSIVKKNWEKYKYLKTDDYGPFIKYLWYRLRLLIGMNILS